MGSNTDIKQQRERRLNTGELFRKYGILMVLILLFLIFFCASETFRTPKNMVNILRQVSINGVIAVGMTYVIMTGGIDLTVGSLVAVSGVVAGSILVVHPTWVIPAVLAAIFVCALFGVLNGIMVSRAKVPAFIVTLSAMTMGRGFAYVYSDGKPYTLASESFSKIGSGYTPIIIFLLIVVILHILLAKTKFGRYIYATGGNIKAANASGVKVNRIITQVYILSAVLAGIAGILLASRTNSGQPAVGVAYETDAIAATVIGGTSMAGGSGRITGTFIGVLIIGILNNGLNLLDVSSYYQQIIKGIIILVAVCFDMKNKKVAG